MASVVTTIQHSNTPLLQEKYAWRRLAHSHVTAFQPAESRHGRGPLDQAQMRDRVSFELDSAANK